MRQHPHVNGVHFGVSIQALHVVPVPLYHPEVQDIAGESRVQQTRCCLPLPVPTPQLGQAVPERMQMQGNRWTSS